jgi:activator of HSP90 ATPase
LGRRDFAARAIALLSGLSAARTALGFTDSLGPAGPVAVDEVSHSAETIHQEVGFKSRPGRVYEALIDDKQFDHVVQLSEAMQSGMSLGTKPTQISREVGGAFSLFGGHIVGRHIELVPDERIVQAWRVANWSPGVYSIARFELAAQGSGAKLVFDHTGFPEGQGQHLADGWKSNYWQPLTKYLG